MTRAWRRLGLLKPGEAFTRDRYVDCVRASVAKLRKESFITGKVATFYLAQAAQGELPKQ
ncbi:MAG: hypothetical protein HY652_04685 [Acidobacteria bacterium]|nr:hypothetical protein [Acidobacteriota bacterium]